MEEDLHYHHRVQQASVSIFLNRKAMHFVLHLIGFTFVLSHKEVAEDTRVDIIHPASENRDQSWYYTII